MQISNAKYDAFRGHDDQRGLRTTTRPDAVGFDANVTQIKCWPCVALLARIGKYGRFSLRYRMKVK